MSTSPISPASPDVITGLADQANEEMVPLEIIHETPSRVVGILPDGTIYKGINYRIYRSNDQGTS